MISGSLAHTHTHTVLCCLHHHDNQVLHVDGFPSSFIYSSISAILLQTTTYTYTDVHPCASSHTMLPNIHQPSFTGWFDHQSLYQRWSRHLSAPDCRREYCLCLCFIQMVWTFLFCLRNKLKEPAMQTRLLQMVCLCLSLCVCFCHSSHLLYCNVISSDVRAAMFFMWRLSVGKWLRTTGTEKKKAAH